jgi:thiol-disulfide isomerase/thioredoxin
MIAPMVEALARKYAGRLKVTKVNVDENPLLATRFNIQGIPTLGFFIIQLPEEQRRGLRPCMRSSEPSPVRC